MGIKMEGVIDGACRTEASKMCFFVCSVLRGFIFVVVNVVKSIDVALSANADVYRQ